MALDIIEKITKAEADADKERLSANISAKKMLADAEKEGKLEYEAIIARANAQVAEMAEKAEDAAIEQTRAIESEIERQSDELRDIAKERMDKASTFIIEKVVSD